jgi:hypothetical protein
VHDIQAKIEVIPKFSLRDKLLEILIGGGNEAHIRAQSLVSPDALKGALLTDHAQQLHLRAGVDLSDLVEKDGAAIGLLEPADAALMRPGERAALVPEQFAFEQLRRERRAMHGDELRLVPPA